MGAAAGREPARGRDRFFLRTVRYRDGIVDAPPGPVVRAWLADLDRTGRLVAAGPIDSPPGHLLVLRARDGAEARRALREDPFVGAEAEISLSEWTVGAWGSGVNLLPPPARGAGRLTVLHRISVFVSDHAIALPWYREVLGLALRAQDPATEYYELSLGPGAAGLVLVRPRPEWGAGHYEEARRRIGTATGIAFLTDNVSALALRLEHAGQPPLEGPSADPWGGRTLRFADPDGNEFVALDRGGPAPVRVPRKARRPHRRRRDSAGATPL